MSRKPETKFRADVVMPFLRKLERCDYTAIQQVALRGDPDLILCINGNLVGLELKAEDGTLSSLQHYKLSCIVDAGGISMAVSPLNWSLAQKYLADLDAGYPPHQRHFGFTPLKLVKVKPRTKKKGKV